MMTLFTHIPKPTLTEDSVVCYRLLIGTNVKLIGPVSWGQIVQLGTWLLRSKLTFGSVVRVIVSLWEMNIGLCNVPKNYRDLIYV